MVPLKLLKVGECGQVCQVVGMPEEVHRLAELGFRPGKRVQMLQPGETCVVRLEDCRMCFRQSELFHVLVEPQP